MRLRNIKGSREMIDKSEYVVHKPDKYKGKWKYMFENDHEVHVEIGMGKGKFIMEQAISHPENNYIGIEKYSSVLIRALEKRRETMLSNLYFIRFDAENLNDIFDVDDIARIYLNFSDPWPKDRHAKRRLTSKEFLSRYNKCLIKGGNIVFKTDNRGLFDFSLEQVKEAGWQLNQVIYDLHNSEYLYGNIMTEYEERFAGEGRPIYCIIFQK
jgi:tRNA (guanine-N7-)-methyltransferase